MFKRHVLACALLSAFGACAWAGPNAVTSASPSPNDLAQLRADFEAMKQAYEARIQALEQQLQSTQQLATQAAAQPPVQAAAGSNAFNPDISLILSGTYASRSNPQPYNITGFQAGGEIAPADRGFNLGESELGIYANVDPNFYGGLNLALAPDNTVGVEEAFVQTTSLPANLTLKMGRFYSGIGYQNARHAHTWDFVDNPLVYAAFLGNQFADDGLQLKWLAPTDFFLELGAEMGRGRIAESSGRSKNGTAAGAVYGHVGGDWGISSSWRAGLSYLQVSPEDRQSTDVDATGSVVTNTFNGQSKIAIADLVYKWAPNGNPVDQNFTFQTEFMHRSEDGLLNTDSYRASQSGWYAQGVYQFVKGWRTGLRLDRLNGGSVDYGANTSNLAFTGYNPKRLSWMIDYNPSEFSRIRLQLARDESSQLRADNQLFVQYQMSLGAHGAHSY
ncbi:MAG TPA: hypothetical protein VGE55_00750 [Limnobacter sp.]|uniref:hypothetical protein n=1 Tax=Limnobacter sp. TaxID=2003368 RepID=UPI002EDA2C11